MIHEIDRKAIDAKKNPLSQTPYNANTWHSVFTQFKYNNFSSLILNKIINLIHLLKNVTYCLAPYIIISCLHILLYPFSNCFIRYKPYLFGYFSETITLIVQSVY